MQARDYEAELKSDVDQAERDRVSVKELYDLNKPSPRNADAPHPYQDKMDRAEAALKACKARLAALRRLDHGAMAMEIAELRAAVAPEIIKRAVDDVRTKLTAAALMQLEATLQLLQLDGEFRTRIRRAQELENELLGTSKPVDFFKQPGFSEFRAQLSRQDLLAELERLADSDDTSQLRQALGRDPTGRLMIGGLTAPEALSRAGL
jgi:hypothetical protein